MKRNFILILVLSVMVFACFASTSWGCPNPEVASLSVTKADNTQTVDLTITGSKFYKSAHVKLTKDGQPDIMATNVMVESSTELTCTLDFNGKAIGQWNVIVANIGNFFPQGPLNHSNQCFHRWISRSGDKSH